ncbi:MAG: ABC transporter ATP-binding protein NatA [Calditrichaeota bacterium]|nr:ABC transporter ATP-binding protein NatA [Calditrichota bacterium]
MPEIEVRNLSKVFADRKRGRIRAVDNISFDVNRGEIFGLLGTNGAGKTTTLRMLATILTPSAGTAVVAGHDVVHEPAAVRAKIGYLTGDTNLYTRLTPREMLRYYGSLFSLGRDELRSAINQVSERFGLHEFIDTKIGKLSTGQRQRVSIARAVLQRPELMIFDEPTAGLDPVGARHIVEFIRENRRGGQTLLFSTHYLREAEKLCDRLAVMHEGTIRASGTLAEILAQTGAGDIEQAFFALAGVEASAAPAAQSA